MEPSFNVGSEAAISHQTIVDVVAKKPGSKATGKKRTKTGCLTCRKRRIKCGEEKPTCTNCVKSKRNCEGYNQRVVFKDPLSFYRPTFTTPSLNYKIERSHVAQEAQPQIRAKNHAIAPKPISLTEHPSHTNHSSESAQPHSPDHERTRTYSVYETETPKIVQSNSQQNLKLIVDEQRQLGVRNGKEAPYTASSLPHVSSQTTQNAFSFEDTSSITHEGLPSAVSQLSPITSSPCPKQDGSRSNISRPEFSILPRHQILNTAPPHRSSSDFDDAYHTWEEDLDDPFDVSDDDLDVEDSFYRNHKSRQEFDRRKEISDIIAFQARQDSQRLETRSFLSFIDRHDILAEYVPTYSSTPVKDPMSARIFCHFVNVTAPSMSMFERNPANPSLLFEAMDVPISQRNLWSYTFPTLALRDNGLMHAILALSSLHISRLQDTPITPSLRHYALGIRRLSKRLKSDRQRRQPATLAAAMLLAFYECWAADHQKWSNHLLGAKQLVSEINLADRTREIRRRYAQSIKVDSFCNPRGYIDVEIDETLVSIIIGKRMSYDFCGQVLSDSTASFKLKEVNLELDIEMYETQRDLFWWYSKQDVYQSILGGGPLFLPYSQWIVPPRARIGRLTAVFGTFDHLILLMGRLADFVVKDLKRKRAVIKSNGGQWQPPDSTRQQSSAGHDGSGQPHSRGPAQMPPFSGMVPNVREATLPMGFEDIGGRGGMHDAGQDEADLETQTIDAHAEWQEIKQAFDIIEAHFGPDFQPLGPEFSLPIPSPFGAALQYRTYPIAGVWLNFYMALIFLYRSHPTMPPAAVVSVHYAAHQTAVFANRVGQIAAGLAPDCSIITEVNPGVGAALIESSTCLFMSGVQYQDAAQRTWTVNRLRDIARLTGWQTSLAIAAGCETAWLKAAENGRGPVYNRSQDEERIPDIWVINGRRIDRALYGKTNAERRFVIEKPDRVQYAIGLLGLEGDFEHLDIDSRH